MNQYESVYKNTGTTPRTLDQAYKNADYATPIYRHSNPEWEDAKEFFIGAFSVMAILSLGAVVGISFLAWLGVAFAK